MDFETLYYILFNAVTDAIESIDKMDFLEARQTLIAAQQKTEERYIDLSHA